MRDLAHPPSVSEVYRQTVTKGQAVVEIEFSGQNHILRYGQPAAVLVTLSSNPSGHVHAGTVRLSMARLCSTRGRRG